MVPILDKSLKMSSSSNDQLRQTVTVTENLTRLVNNRREIESYIPILMPGVEKVVNNASLPEVRDLGAKALQVLQEAKDEQSDGKFHGRISREQAEAFFSENLSAEVKPVAEALLRVDLEKTYLSTVLQTDANVNDWKRLAEYLASASESVSDVDADVQKKYAAEVVTNVKALFNSSNQAAEELEEGAVEVVNTDFSLAYGSRMLLNKTTLRLLKGHRYGLCGRNGAGKSTLMRAISKGQLEGFPSPDELRTCFVEHRLQGEEGDMDLVGFIGSDPELKHVSTDEIAGALKLGWFP